MKNSIKENKGSLWLNLCGLIFVIVAWSITPVLNPYYYRYISPTICTFIVGVSAVLTLIPFVYKHLSEISVSFLKIAIPTGLISAVASITQKIGLMYTTPSRYSFLENLSCVVVPVVSYILIRRKPNKLKIAAAILCLFGCFVLSGGWKLGAGGFGIGELLCSFAGILYGVNIAVTGAYAKRICAPLFVMVHMIIYTLTSVLYTLALSFTSIVEIYFEWNIGIILLIALTAFISNTICWMVRTTVLKRLDATVVATMMPFSAVLTGIISVIFGLDTLSWGLIVGGGVVLVASILAGFGDINQADGEQKK